MKKYACSLLGALAAFAVVPVDLPGVGMAAAFAAAPESADDCLSFENEAGEKSMTVHAANLCERRLSCLLKYVVRCEDNDRKTTSTARLRVMFALGAKGTTDLTLSARACKQGYAIEDVTWTCS